ncbi:MAG: sigma-70 family RNA polymerase sigma factor [Pirellulales bacterium]
MPLSFPSTQWTLVRKLSDPQTREDAFQALCKKYWGPVYAFLCQRFQSADAEDITQEFFFIVMKQELFQRADSAEGKLRSWLLKSLSYCVSNRIRTQNSVKRGGRVKIIGLQDESFRTELQGIAACATTPTDAFDKAWLNNILHNTLEALSHQYREADKLKLFEALQPWLIGDQDESSQAEAALRCSVSTANFRVQLYRLRKRYSQELRKQIMDTLENEEQFDEEVMRLFNISRKTG